MRYRIFLNIFLNEIHDVVLGRNVIIVNENITVLHTMPKKYALV